MLFFFLNLPKILTLVVMKIRNIWIVLFLAIASTLVFQSIWLYNSFKSKRNDIEHIVNIKLKETVDSEVKLRYKKCFNGEDDDEKILLSNEKLPEDGHLVNFEEMLESGIHQQILIYQGCDLDIIVLDSIFKEKLTKIGFSLNYSLCYKDSTKVIIDQIGNLSQSKINKAFHSESLLIVDGKRVQAIVDISPFTVFKQMISLLVASFVMLVVIMFCVFYQAKIIYNQYKLNKLREDFTNALTHDMKTPLSTINTVLSNFRSGLLDNKPDMQEKHGKIAMDQVASLLLVVEKILTIAMLEEGKNMINKTQTNIHAMIKELEERFSISNEKQVSIHSIIDIDKNETIYIDTTLIKNAIGNLIENAIKYSGNSVKINIHCFILDKRLYIRVEDNGSGISDKNKEIIFEKFERGAATGKKGAKGFGLGLSYVKRVTEAHSGIVTLFSHKGKGSEFSILLPLPEPDDEYGIT